jgi:hypothetical protein
MPVTDADERLHPVEDPSEHWSDSLYFNAWDPATNTFLLTRIAVLANKGEVTAGYVVWVDGMPVYAYNHVLDHVPDTDWDVMTVGGLSYRMLRSCQTWAVQLDDGDNAKAHLEWDGFSGAVHYDDGEAKLPKAVAWGHYEQSCRVRGDLVIGERRIAFDGMGQRDHSWGYRHWAGLHQWHWITGFFGEDRAFNLFEVHEHDGSISVNGFVHDDGADRFITSAVRDMRRDDSGAPTSYVLTLTLQDGGERKITGTGEGFVIPVRPAADQPVVVHEALMRLESDGVEGFGIYEHLVTEFD